MNKVWRFAKKFPAIPLALLVGATVGALSVAGLGAAAQWTATIFVGGFVAWTVAGMVRDLMRGHVGLDILAVVAMIATLAVGEYVAALIVVLMLSGGEALEELAAQRARRDLSALLEHAPQTAHLVETSDGVERLREVDAAEVRTGDVVLVRPAEVVPVDGVLLDAAGEFDESTLTGEPLPVPRAAGDEIPSGAVNGAEAVRLRALRGSGESQYQQIVAMVREAEASRAPMVRLADRYAIPFTAVSLLIAGVAWAVSGDPVRFAEVLVLATPCPLLIAAPVAFLGGLSRTAKAGVVVKGGGVLEQLARVQSAAFDKTGTVTRGRPELTSIVVADGVPQDRLLALAASAEQYSTHVFADGVLRAARERGLELFPSSDAREVATNGVSATVDGHVVVVGKPAYVAGIDAATRPVPLQPGEAAAYVAVDGRFAGALVLSDDPRPEAAATIAWLRENGVGRIAMLTGDAAPTARSVADTVGIEEVHAELLPADKVHLAAEMTPRPVLMVGDGVNDAPVLAAADVGIAMGARGSTAAGEAASAVVLRDSLAPVADAVGIARHTVRVAVTAIWIGIALSVVLMLIATTGAIPAVVGALTQELVDVACIVYALRALRGKDRVAAWSGAAGRQ